MHSEGQRVALGPSLLGWQPGRLLCFYERGGELCSEGWGDLPGVHLLPHTLLSGCFKWVVLIETSFPFFILCPLFPFRS